MGRKLMRVPMDFDWPIGQIWAGYVNPYRPVSCAACEGRGSSAAYRELEKSWYALESHDYRPVPGVPGRQWNARALQHNLTDEDIAALVKKGRLMVFTRRPRNAEQEEMLRKRAEAGGSNFWLKEDNGYIPTAAEVNEWSKRGMGHDGTASWVVIKARLKKSGASWKCAACKGEGSFWQSPEIEKASEAWVDIEPPKGDGYQLWGTTSEGEPRSPVFATPEELAAWCAPNTSIFGYEMADYETWLRMFKDDSVDVGSLGIVIPAAGYVGSYANAPEEAP